LIGARRANKIILIATPSLIAIATFLSEFTRTQMNAGGNYQLGMLLSVLLQFIYLAVFVAPAVSMVAASIARRKAPPVEQVAAAS
jgi:ABC-type multidrug transport system permease subunit